MYNKNAFVLLIVTLTLNLTACSPEVGSDKWCQQMKEKPKGNWTVNEASEFTKSCLLK